MQQLVFSKTQEAEIGALQIISKHVQGFTFIKCNLKHVVRWKQRTQRFFNKKQAQWTNLNFKTAIKQKIAQKTFWIELQACLFKETQIVLNVLVYIKSTN